MIKSDGDAQFSALDKTIVFGVVIVLVGLYLVLTGSGGQRENAVPQFVSIDLPLDSAE